MTSATVHVWWARCSPVTAEHLHWLSPTERTRVQRLHRARDRDRSLLGAVLLRWAAAQLTGIPPAGIPVVRRCPDCGGPHGRPTIGTGPGSGAVSVSVSHAGDWVVVAASRDATVGVDVEHVTDLGDELPSLVASTLAPAEQPFARDAHSFTQLWVRKEATLKATGEGLTVPPRDLSVHPGRRAGAATATRDWVAERAGDGVAGGVDLATDATHVAAVAALGAPRLAVTTHVWATGTAGTGAA